MAKNKAHYGTFVTKRPWYFGRKFMTVAGISAAVLILAVVFWRNDKKQEQTSLLNIPQAVASEIPGWWYEKYFLQGECEKDHCKPEADPDEDKLTNMQEFFYHTDPLEAHTIGDVLDDGELVAQGFDPSRPGRMVFEQVVSEDNILEESLLLSQDVKQIASEEADITKVPLPLPADDELDVAFAETRDVYEKYVSDLKDTINKYFSNEDIEEINALLRSGGNSDVSGIKNKSAQLATELKHVQVPLKAVTFHKYTVAFYQLLSEVLITDGSTLDLSSPESDVWFEKTRALLAVSQKLNYEQERLSTELKR